MTDQEKVKAIVDKYDQSIADLANKGTAKEFKFVIKYIADQANLMQRKTAGLDN